MSEEKKEGIPKDKKDQISDKKISRRSMLKWTGALAGAAVVGGAAVYAATYKAPPPPPPNFKPPLSPEVQTAVDGIVQDLVNRHQGETIMYGACSCNCSGTGCFFKWHVKNGVVTAQEPDDTDHPNVGREDTVMTQQDLDWAQFQRRGCPVGWGFIPDHLYSPDRVLYPIQRAPGTNRGENKWVRISWDQAYSTIASNMVQLKAKYGPFYLLCSYGGRTAGFAAVGQILGSGTQGYGLCTDDVARINGPFAGLGSYAFSTAPGNDMPDSLKYSKLVISFGNTHFTTHWGGSAFAAGWYRRMQREKGTPIIFIDPKYTWDAEVWADQYIPIKPGTDTALLMGMAYVILTEGMYDKTWTDKYLYGFQQQADYILGKGGKGIGDYKNPAAQGIGFDVDYTQYDTIPKTPEWAEAICAVPADTIRELARLYGKTKPAVLIRHAGASRKSYGEYFLKMQWFLNIITGNGPYVQGGYVDNQLSTRSYPIALGALPSTVGAGGASGGSAVIYSIPTFYRSYHWWKAVEYGVNVLNGGPSIMYPGQKMTWDEWGILVGFCASPQFLTMFNPRMLWGNASDPVVMGENSNAQIRAMTNPNIEFSFHQHTRITTTGKYSDMIVPILDYTFELSDWTAAGYGSFDGQIYIANPSKVPGECKGVDNVCCGILNKIGGLQLAQQYWSGYKSEETFVQDWEAENARRWEKGGRAWLAAHGVSNPPTWDQVVKADKGHGLTQWHDGQFTPNIDTYAAQPAYGTKIDTKTGKAELYWDTIAPGQEKARGLEHFDYKGRKYAHIPNNWKDLQPLAVYHPCYNGMEDYPAGRLKTYPLFLLTPNSRYNIHYLMGDPGNPRTYQCKRHSVIMSPTDAKARGIKDNDLVRVFNPQGQVLVSAYVTNRIMPGVLQLRTGRPPRFASGVGGRPDVMDLGGSVNIFTGGDDVSPVTPAKVTTTVQVEKYGDGKVY